MLLVRVHQKLGGNCPRSALCQSEPVCCRPRALPCLRAVARLCTSKEKSLEKVQDKPLQKEPPPQKKQEPRTTLRKKSIKVALLASENRMGMAAALSLKTRGGHVGELRLWDERSSLRGTGLDLSHIPTSVRVNTYVGQGQLHQALRKTDVAVVLGGAWAAESEADLFYQNCEPLREVARAVAEAAPRTLVGIALSPVASLTAFFGEVLRTSGASPERLVGLLSLEEMRARRLLAASLSLPPAAVRVHLLGGSSPSSLVPVLESGPGGEYLKKEEAIVLTNAIRTHTAALLRETRGQGPDLAAGLAVADFVRAAAEGMCTERRPQRSLVVRTDYLPGVSYLALPVSLGPAGVETVGRLPKMSEREFKLLLSSLASLKEDLYVGEMWAHSRRHKALRCN